VLIPLEEKVQIVRRLVEERMKRSLLGRFLLPEVSDMSVEEAMGSPEATIVTIVEAYHNLRSIGASATEALTAIEKFRSSLAPGQMPRGCTLEDYVKYRVRLEHKRGVQMRDPEISRACSVTSGLIERFFPPKQEKFHPDFILRLPEVGRYDRIYDGGDIQLLYFKNPRTIGPDTVECPHVIVVSDGKRPRMIVRVERDDQGYKLCSIMPDGNCTYYNDYAASLDQTGFVAKVIDLLEMQMRTA
jgi:hypothetical protein